MCLSEESYTIWATWEYHLRNTKLSIENYYKTSYKNLCGMRKIVLKSKVVLSLNRPRQRKRPYAPWRTKVIWVSFQYCYFSFKEKYVCCTHGTLEMWSIVATPDPPRLSLIVCWGWAKVKLGRSCWRWKWHKITHSKHHQQPRFKRKRDMSWNIFYQ